MMKQAENPINHARRPQQQQHPSGPRETLQGPYSGRARGKSCFSNDAVPSQLDLSQFLGGQAEWDTRGLSNPMPVIESGVCAEVLLRNCERNIVFLKG